MAVRYVGGTAGAADTSKEPVTIGWVNEQGGVASPEEATAGLQAAVSLVNERLGGVGGHPLEVVTCFAANTEEEGQKCAQTMYNDGSISLVLTGSAAKAASPLHSTLADSKPILGVQPSSTVDLSAKNAYYTGVGPFGQTAQIKYLIEELGARRIALIAPSFAGTTIALQQINEIAQASDAEVTSGLYDQGSAAVSTAVLASQARTADAVLVLEPSVSGCVAVANALAQYAITAPVVSLSSCADAGTVGLALGDIPKWTYPLPPLVPSMSVDDPSDETAVYLAAMQEYRPGSTVSGMAPVSFSTLMYAVSLMNKLGVAELSAANLSSAIAASTGPVFNGVPELTFGSGPMPTVGSSAVRFYTYEGGGTWKSAAAGKWIS